MPPQFLVDEGADGSWWYVPGNASDTSDVDCVGGWNDPTNDVYCNDDYCDSVKVRLWGSDYIAFKADTTYYDVETDDRFLRVKLNWMPNAMHDSTELWVSVVKYPSAKGAKPLFELGSEATSITTEVFGPEDAGAIIDVHGFHEGGNEGAAVILSLVGTHFEHYSVDCNGFNWIYCLPRFTSNPTDLTYAYSFAVLPETGGGCPFVRVLTPQGVVTDNNILAGALGSDDRRDLYRLERTPDVAQGAYRLQLSEQHTELSHLDMVELLVVDHPPGSSVAVLPGSEIGTYRVGSGPVACLSQAGTDLLELVEENDDRAALVEPGSWIEVHFPAAGRGGGGVGTRGKPEQKIPPPPGGGGGGRASDGIIDLTELCYRANEHTRILPIPAAAVVENGVIKVRMTAPVDFHVDQLFLADLAEEPPSARSCGLASAMHSVSGSCVEALSADDGRRVTLAPGETLELAFASADPHVGTERDFLLAADGHYETLPDREQPGGEKTADRPQVLALYPNPFAENTRIRFAMPDPGGRASVRIYNLAGRLVRELGEDIVAPGLYEIEWDATDAAGRRVAAGVYFYHIEAPGVLEQRKAVVVR